MNIIKNIIELKGSDIIDKIIYTIKISEDNRKKIIELKNDETCLKILTKDNFMYNTVVNGVNLMIYISDKYDMKYWNKAEQILMDYNYKYNSDNKIFNKLIKILNRTDNNDYKMFLVKQLQLMKKHGLPLSKNNNNINIILKNIDKHEQYISDYICKPIKIKLKKENIEQTEFLLSSIQSDENNIIVDRNTFNYLIKRISDREIRSELEMTYIKQINKIIPVLSKIILLRDKYAKLLNKENYSELINNKKEEDVNNIKSLLLNLNITLDEELKKSMKYIRKEINIENTEKIELHDIVFVLNKMIPDIKFSPLQTLNTIFHIFEKYFKISVKREDDTVFENCFKITLYNNKNSKIGSIYIDVIKRNDKNIKQPQFVILNNNYNDENNINLPNIYLLASYQNMTTNCLSYNDVIYLFREFGNILWKIVAITPVGVCEDDIEITEFVATIMEYFVSDDEIINILTKDINKETLNKFKIYKHIDTIINLKFKCFDAIIDNIINGSSDIINLLQHEKSNNVLLDVYENIYKKIFNQVNDIFNTNVTYINPIIIQNCIKNNQCIVYTTIINIIIAYNAYILIKKGKGEIFIRDVLYNTKYCYKQSIDNFINEMGKDYYTNFIEKYLEISIKINNTNIYSEQI